MLSLSTLALPHQMAALAQAEAGPLHLGHHGWACPAAISLQPGPCTLHGGALPLLPEWDSPNTKWVQLLERLVLRVFVGV